MKRFKTRIIEKPKIHIRKVNKSNKKEQEFYKNLMECIYKSQCDRLSELLEKKTINLERRDKFGNSPLNTWVQIGNHKILAILIAHGADVAVANDLGNTPLHYSIAYKFASITQQLINSGADQLYKNQKNKIPWEGI